MFVQWLFYINFPFCGVGLLIVPLTVRLKPEKNRTLKENLARVDWAGGIFFIASTSSFLIGLTWSGIQYPWNSYQAWLPTVLGGVGLVLSVVYEVRIPAVPFLRVSVFSGVSAVLVYLCTAVHGFLVCPPLCPPLGLPREISTDKRCPADKLFSHLFYIMLYYQSIKAMDSTQVGAIMVAVNLILFPASIITGILIKRRGQFLWAVWGGLGISTLGNALLFLLDESRSVVATVFILLVSSVGQGLLLSALNVATQAIAKTTDVAYAVSMFMFMRTFGMCLGVALGGTAFQNVLLRALERRNVPHAFEIAVDAEPFVQTLVAMSDSPEKAAILAGYVEGFHGVFTLLVSLCGACFIASFFMKHYTLDKGLDSEHKIQRKEGLRV